eukprot:CAMPEP_0172395890 /NCGR_PEP_ID=MMETSP1061-20121228/22358_1 /TAXON_ID=37318 /ORGANISM="Pseudo-nitzschia pungens, Strain cf. pungens" /LENGTH=39 /DNA_ID= /DNA_START= /DNA_END= /DNA_ORIENTATION=
MSARTELSLAEQLNDIEEGEGMLVDANDADADADADAST